MIKNMGSADRIIRVLLVLTIVIAYAMGLFSGTIGNTLLAISGILLLTSLVGTCPLYYPLRISTRSKKIPAQQGVHRKESSL